MAGTVTFETLMSTKGGKVHRLLKSTELNEMLKALRKTKAFIVERDNSALTVIVKHPQTQKEVLRACGKGDKTWVTSYADDLFV